MRYQAALHPDLAPYLFASSAHGNPPPPEKKRRHWRAATLARVAPMPAIVLPLRNQNGTRELPMTNCVKETKTMNGIIYLVGLVVIVMAILSFFGLR